MYACACVQQERERETEKQRQGGQERQKEKDLLLGIAHVIMETGKSRSRRAVSICEYSFKSLRPKKGNA